MTLQIADVRLDTLPAAYLECRYDRAQALRVIAARLRHELYDAPCDSVASVRLRSRLARAYRHLTELTGAVA